jgi:hypothetical protein
MTRTGKLIRTARLAHKRSSIRWIRHMEAQPSGRR